MKRVVAAAATVSVVLSSLAVVSLPAVADPDGSMGTVAERPRDAAVHVIDGEVRSVAQVGDTVVLGGTFTKAGPATRGAIGVVDLADKSFAAGFPEVVGAVEAVAADGAGGWYLAGTFTSVGGQPRTNLAQVDAAGAVTAFDPSPNAPVRALAVLPGGGLLAGGDFTQIAGASANRLVALDGQGSLIWSGDVTGGSVRSLALAADESHAYVGGEFSKIAGVERRRLAAVSIADGTLNTAFAPGTVNNSVLDLIVRGSEVLLAGDFTKVNGQTRNRLAAVHETSGALGELSVSINNSVRDIDLGASGDTLYLAGRFSSVGGESRPRLAAVDLGSGLPTGLTLSNISGDLAAVTSDEAAGTVYVGGSMQFTPEKGNPAVLARVDLASGAATEVVPYAQTPRSLARPPVSGTSGAGVLVKSGASLLVAGDFSDYGAVTRNHILGYDLTTGALLDSFNPNADAQVNTVKASPDNAFVYVGGEFTTIAGQSRSRIAKLAVGDGSAVAGFQAEANSYVKDMAVRPDGSAVYIGGNFSSFNGVPSDRLVSVDPDTGALRPDFQLPLTEPTNESSEGGLRAMALSADSSRLMVIGNFRKIAGINRPLVAQIDVSVSPATVTDWRTELYDQPCARAGKVGFMRDIDISPDGSTAYIVSAGHFYYPACDTANAFPMSDATGNAQPLWSKKIGDTMEAVAAAENTVYISGHFRYLETETRSEPRFQIAALDADTGDGLNWIPNAGGYRGVLTVELEPAGLFAGSDGDAFGLVNHGRNAFWPTPDPGIDVTKTPNRSWVLAAGAPVTFTVRAQNTFLDRDLTLTSLQDTGLGDLNGQGTCVLPQTVAPGASYACALTEQVAGPAATSVAGTLTATATPTGDSAGGPVTDSDTSNIDILSSAAVFRLRAVVGPGIVSFPSEVVRFHVALMNLDPVRSATLSTLTSPQFGSLSSDCGLPRTLGPNRLHYCHLDREVGGSVGSRPAFSFTGQAQYSTGTLSASSSSSVTVNPPVGGTKVLAVVANPAVLTGTEKRIQDNLAASFSVTYADDDTVQLSDVTSDYSFVIIGPSAVESRLGNRLAGIPTSVMVTHSRMLDEMAMTAAGGNGSATGTTVDMVTPMHPLSAAKYGTQTIHTADQSLTWGTPASGAAVIAEVAPGQATEFAYPEGASMAAGPAAACRVFFNAANTTKFASNAWTLFNRAAAYAGTECGKNMLWTAAGNGSTSYGTGEGRTSLAVGLGLPYGLAIDDQNRIYVADASTHAVRRIDPDGTTVTVAGSGTAGFSGDGGPAAAARLNTPVRLAFNPAGDLFIADSANHRIRKVNMSTGVITTVVGTGTAGFSGDGGQAAAARLRFPYDVTFASSGTMYIADRTNHRVRRVTTSGVISTVAGTGTAGFNGDDIAATSARLSSPYGVAVDDAGNLFIADYDNERVRVVDTSGVISTFAGTGVATADGDGGLATEAGLHKPLYVQITAGGDVIISEANNNDIRLVHDGVIVTLAGSRQFGYLGDGGVPIFSTWQRPSATVLDQQGNLWVADRYNRRLRVIQAS